MASLLPQHLDALSALRPAVRALVAHVLNTRQSDADVDDCTSEAFRRALEGHERLHAGAPIRPWLLGIAHHVALDARRARGRALARSAPTAAEDESDSLDRLRDKGPDPHEQVELEQRNRRLQAAMQLLPEDQRRVLFMHAQGLGYREISAELSVPIGTVCTWISRARQQLARTLNDSSPEQTR
jgi:RNA polymerase sigma factor (sigma-70 family)